MIKSSYNKKSREAHNDTRSVMRILSNINRYHLMSLLISTKRNLCVYELSEHIGLSQSATSHQLAYLEARGVVKSIRIGRTKCYFPTHTNLTKKIRTVINALK